MFKIDYGEIIPGERIGKIKLGMHQEDVFKLLNDNNINYLIESLPDSLVIVTANIKIWISKSSGLATQVLVYNKFRGKLKNKIGIGSTLQNVENYIGKYTSELDTYVLKALPGICFQLEDDCDKIDDSWNECDIPIGFISIYKD